MVVVQWSIGELARLAQKVAEHVDDGRPLEEEIKSALRELRDEQVVVVILPGVPSGPG